MKFIFVAALSVLSCTSVNNNVKTLQGSTNWSMEVDKSFVRIAGTPQIDHEDAYETLTVVNPAKTALLQVAAVDKIHDHTKLVTMFRERISQNAGVTVGNVTQSTSIPGGIGFMFKVGDSVGLFITVTGESYTYIILGIADTTVENTKEAVFSAINSFRFK